MSPEEASALSRSLSNRALYEDAIRFAEADSSFAGARRDGAHRGQIIFYFTDVAGKRDDLRSLIPDDLPFQVVDVSQTLSELTADQDLVWKDIDELQTEGLPINAVGIDIEYNSISVGTQVDAPAVAEAIKQRYGLDVTVVTDGPIVHDTCSSRDACADPLKGGLHIHAGGYPTGTGDCTSAYLGKKSGNLVLATAGHCISIDGGVGHNWKHNGIVIGSTISSTWHDGAQTDLGLIDVTESGDLNLFYASSNLDIRALQTLVHDGSQLSGDFLCRGAITTGYQCGHIVNTDKYKGVDGNHIYNAWVVDFDASPGDSGAPYFYNYSGWGQHMDSTDDTAPLPHFAWYTTVDSVSIYGGLSICLSYVC